MDRQDSSLLVLSVIKDDHRCQLIARGAYGGPFIDRPSPNRSGLEIQDASNHLRISRANTSREMGLDT